MAHTTLAVPSGSRYSDLTEAQQHQLNRFVEQHGPTSWRGLGPAGAPSVLFEAVNGEKVRCLPDGTLGNPAAWLRAA